LANKKATMLDVARRAGVSYQTVSRVINNRPDVSDETRRKIQEIIDELGYHPSAAARSLVSSKTRALGLITADFSDYFFTQVIVGAEQEARKHGYFLMLSSTERNPADEPEYFRLLTEQRVEGILFARPSTELEHEESHIATLIEQGVPLVTTAYHASGQPLTVVDVDNVDGGYQAAHHLVEMGHRAIGMITGPANWRSVNERTHGYRLALEAVGLDYDAALVEQGDWSYESGYRAMRVLLDRAPHLTAIFSQNDQMAIGAMSALHALGRRIPDEIAVVGFDDIPVAAYSQPRLTTIRQPMQEVGRVAARLLMELIDHPEAKTQEILMKPELMLRDSA
jgi:DNA-binding LacI/PurR family transcriptional regulator